MRFVLDIGHIREELNELPFRDGKREVFVGRISEMFEEESEQAIAKHLGQFEQELRESHADLGPSTRTTGMPYLSFKNYGH